MTHPPAPVETNFAEGYVDQYERSMGNWAIAGVVFLLLIGLGIFFIREYRLSQMPQSKVYNIGFDTGKNAAENHWHPNAEGNFAAFLSNDSDSYMRIRGNLDTMTLRQWYLDGFQAGYEEGSRQPEDPPVGDSSESK